MNRLNLLFRQTFAAAALPLVLAACGGGSAGDPPAPPAPAPAPVPAPAPAPAPDTTAPTLAITGTGPTAATSAVTLTFTFSEDVGTSFTASDVSVTNGTAGTLAKVDATHYTMAVTPAASSSGTMTIAVAAGSYGDLASNASAAATSVTQDFNTVAAASGNTGTCTAAPCIGFDATGLALVGFGGLVATVDNDPVDATNKVAKLVKHAADPTWAGATIDPSGTGLNVVAPIDFATNKVITLRVYSPAAGEVVMLKPENSVTGSINMEQQATTTVANAWETLSFDYTAPSNGTLDTTKTYDRLSVFPHFNAPLAADSTYYFDEVKYTAKAAVVGGGKVTLTAGVFASNYAQVDAANWISSEGGSAGRYVDTSVATLDWWNGVAPTDSTPSLYFGYGINMATPPWGFGVFVKTPTNATVDVSTYANLKLAVWGNDELTSTHPTFTVLMVGPSIAGCAAKMTSPLSVTGISVQNYTLPLNGFTLTTPCAFGSAAAAMAGGVDEIHVQVLGTNVQYVTGNDGSGNFPNGLNLGPISFN
jgi:hypothetical protein